MSTRPAGVGLRLPLLFLTLWLCTCEGNCETTSPSTWPEVQITVLAGDGSKGDGIVVNKTDPIGDSEFGINCYIRGGETVRDLVASTGAVSQCTSWFDDADGVGAMELIVTPESGHTITRLGGGCVQTSGSTCTLNFSQEHLSPSARVWFDPLEPQAIALSPDALILTGLGQNHAAGLSAAVRDQLGQVMGDAVLSWSSSDENVATATGDGLNATVTGIAAGTATISARAENGVEGSAAVTVDLEALTIFDEMESGDTWFSELLMTVGGAATTARHEAAGGVEGGYRHIEHLLPGVSGLTVFHGFTGETYDPSTQGAITSLDGSYFRRKILPEAPSAVGERFALKQGGTVFYGPAGVFLNLSWELYQVGGLAPLDFLPAPGPDFSASGGPIIFGFLRTNSHTNDSHLTMIHGIDNYKVVIRR